MRAILIIGLFLLSACNATGASHTGQEGGNLVIYRLSGILYVIRDYALDVEGNHCKLANASYFQTNISEKSELTASMWDSPGTTRISVKPGDYVRVELNEERAWGGIAGGVGGGWVGNVVGQSVSSGSGPFILTKVSEATAEHELQGLNRDCE